jgi:ABC-type multidrug transport system fused ATPase/permease subunit
MLDTILKSVRMLPESRRRWWLALPVLASVTGGAEAVAAAAVFGLVKILQDPTSVSTIPIASRVLPLLPSQTPRGLVVEFTALVALFHVAKNVFVVATHYVRHMVVGESSAQLASATLKGYLLAPYPFHFRRDSAELIRNVTQSVSAVLTCVGAALAILSELLVGAGILVVLLAASPGPTLVAGVLLAGLIAALLRWTRRLARESGTGKHDIGRDVYRTLQHALGGIKEIKALGREEYFHRAFVDLQRDILSIGYMGVTLETIPPVLIETVFVTGALIVVSIVTLSGGAGTEGLPVLGLFAYAGFRIIPMANRLTWRLNEIRSSTPAVDALWEDHQLFVGERGRSRDVDGPPLAFASTLAAEHVSYTYPGAPAPALLNVSLAVRRGESVGFVGATGAGKSTLVDVLIGLLPPSAGRVTVDGIPLDAPAGRAWRRRIGYVPQTIFLLDDTVRRNVAFGLPDRDIDDARIRRALDAAQLGGLIASLPEGIDTEVGERGLRLSGGERQRIAIARALYHDPDVLVFDEATSALDAATEEALSGAITALAGRKTILLIAHRLTTVRRCDRLVVVDAGRLVSEGTWETLLAESPAFRRLAQAG